MLDSCPQRIRKRIFQEAYQEYKKIFLAKTDSTRGVFSFMAKDLKISNASISQQKKNGVNNCRIAYLKKRFPLLPVWKSQEYQEYEIYCNSIE